MSDAPAKPRWYRLTPDRVVVLLLAVEGLLLLAEPLHCFSKGWPAMIAIAAVAAALLLMSFWCAVAVLFRWRFQFGIRALLVLTLVVAILCSWLATETKQARKQRTAAQAVVDAGGNVMYDYQRNRYDVTSQPPTPARLRKLLGDDFFVSVAAVDFSSVGVSDDELACIEGLNRLPKLVLTGTEVGDAGLKHLEGLTQLQALYLGRTNVSDAGLAHLKGLTRLRELSLFHTRVGDAGLERLEGLAQLHYLKLDWTKVGDAGLEHLKGLSRLEVLYLGYTKVSDAGLPRLKGLTKLRVLDLYGASVTKAGVQRLKQALPKCTIYH
ncbi:MAG: leucine-rich repeat domain-containing protein [Thermoguttaceae bacterium]